MGMIENGAVWLAGQRSRHLSVPATYHRQDGKTLNLAVTLGTTVFRAENSYGNIVRTESHDFIVDALDFEPQAGDWFTYAGRRYEVLAPNGEPVWRWSGPGQTAMRIHTKEVGNAG